MSDEKQETPKTEQFKIGVPNSIGEPASTIETAVKHILEVCRAPMTAGAKNHARAYWQDGKEAWGKLRAAIEELGK